MSSKDEGSRKASTRPDRKKARASRAVRPSALGVVFLASLAHELAGAHAGPDRSQTFVELLTALRPEELKALLDMLAQAYPEIADQLIVEGEFESLEALDVEKLAEQLADLEANGYLESEEAQRLLASLRNMQLHNGGDTDEDIQLAQAGDAGAAATDAGAGAAGAGEAGAVDIASLPATGAGPAAVGPVIGGWAAGIVGVEATNANTGATAPPTAPPPAPLTITLTDAEAAAQVLAGVQYAAADDVTIAVPNPVAGTQLQTSLKGMQTLGVDTLAISGGTGDVMVTAFNTGEAGPLLSSLPALTGAARVGIDVTQSEFDAFSAANLQAFGSGGFDLIGADGAAAGALSITDAQATNMINAGLVFAEQDDISLTTAAAAGTQLQTSLTGLQALNVDSVVVSGGGSAVINAGTGPIDYGALPTLSDGAASTLKFSDAGFDALSASNLSSLAGSGFERIGASDGTFLITETQAGDMISASLEFVGADAITLAAVGTELSTSVSDLKSLGVDAVRALDSAIGFNSGDAAAMITDGIDLYIRNSDNTLDVTLARLAEIGADRVFTADATPVTLSVKLGTPVIDIDALQTALNNIISDFETSNGAIGTGSNEFRDLFEGGDTVNLRVAGTFTGDLSGLDPGLVAKLELLGIDDILNTDGTSLK